MNQNHFGSIHHIKICSKDENAIMYNENILSDILKVFWNQDSNEIKCMLTMIYQSRKDEEEKKSMKKIRGDSKIL